mmetsp:Transcript_16940/g.33065  ORF Transcript_16940/g.33065 Transcript_16940/m.33065 type:complete len:236 (+) Transcript_16940:380-1087(+)
MFQVHPGRLAALAVKELSVEKLVRGHFLTAGAHVVVEKVLSVLLLALLADDGEGLLNLVGPALAFAEALGILKLVELHVLQAGGTKRVTSAGVLHDLVGPVGTAVDGQAPVFGAGVIHLVGALGLLKETNLAALVLLGDVVHIALPALHGALRLRRDRIGRGHDVLSETRGSGGGVVLKVLLLGGRAVDTSRHLLLGGLGGLREAAGHLHLLCVVAEGRAHRLHACAANRLHHPS